MNVTIGGLRIIHSYHHLIMSLNLQKFHIITCEGYTCRKLTEGDIEILKYGDFSIANMIPYLNREKKYASGFLFFEEETNEPVGYIWVVRRGGNEMSYKIREVDGFISCVCVFKDYRGRNIANLMLAKIVSTLKTEGLTRVSLGVNVDNRPAIQAYKKAGFVVTGEKKYTRILRKNFPYHEI